LSTSHDWEKLIRCQDLNDFNDFKKVRHNDCDIVSGIDGGKQCEACSKYQPIVLQFQEKCLSLSKMNSTSSTPATKSPKKLPVNGNNLSSKNENIFEKKESDSLVRCPIICPRT